MHAAVLHETGKPLQIERVHLADLGPRDVLIKLGASGLCHTDLEVMRGALPLPLPIVLGHEGAGRVEAVGRDVTGVRSGDRVVCSWSPNCGQCYYCDHDQPILCERVVAAVAGGTLPDGRSRLRLGDAALHHFSGGSSHAEYCVVPEARAGPVPAGGPFGPARRIGCGVMRGGRAATPGAPGVPASTAAGP